MPFNLKGNPKEKQTTSSQWMEVGFDDGHNFLPGSQRLNIKVVLLSLTKTKHHPGSS